MYTNKNGHNGYKSIKHVFTMAGHEEIPFAIQSKVITVVMNISKFLKFLYWAADTSLGKSSIHVHVSTVT